MADKILTCVDCGKPFPFTDGEQKFFADKGYTEPKRCSPCRKAKRMNAPKQDMQRG